MCGLYHIMVQHFTGNIISLYLEGGHLDNYTLTASCDENITTLVIVQISNVYHNTFQIVDYIITNLQQNRLAKILDFVS